MSRFKYLVGLVLESLFIAAIFLMIGTVVLYLIVYTNNVICETNWKDYNHKFSPLGGCLVEIDGKWVSTQNVRIIK